MRSIAILEWIRGGGMINCSRDEIPPSLLAEGTSMVSTLIQYFMASGQQVTCCVDARWGFDDLPVGRGIEYMTVHDGREFAAGIPDCWIIAAQGCDRTVVIAPEIDGTLVNVLASLRAAAVELWNCDQPFLGNACDKWNTYLSWKQSGVATPPTALLSELQKEWFESAIEEVLPDHSGRWVVKRRDGAGSEQLWVFTAQTVEELVARWHEIRLCNLRPDNGDLASFIVQPLIEGLALSRCAVCEKPAEETEPRGRIEKDDRRTLTSHWFPLMTQELSDDYKYQGGKLVGAPANCLPPVEWFDSVLASLGQGAAGWVGVDLVCAQSGKWYAIEVNPRFTTSVSHLPPNLFKGATQLSNIFG